MKKRMKRIRCVSALFLSFVMIMGMAAAVSAAETADLDMGQTGSISLTLKDGDGNAVSGGEVTLYKVASLYLDDGNMAYACTGSFSGWTSELDVEDTGLADALAAYVKEMSVSGTAASVGEDGKVSFDGLELGLYLIVQTGASEDYETISPFVVTVPIEENGAWVYAVDASPKVGTVTATEPETPENPDTPETPDNPEAPKTPDTPILPQTGQLNWPIPVLAIAGMLLLLVGWNLKRSDQKRKSNAA